MEQASGHHIVGGMDGCDPLSVGSGGRLEGGGCSPESTGKALQAVSSLLPKKAAQTGFCGVNFPSALKVNMGAVLSAMCRDTWKN